MPLVTAGKGSQAYRQMSHILLNIQICFGESWNLKYSSDLASRTDLSRNSSVPQKLWY